MLIKCHYFRRTLMPIIFVSSTVGDFSRISHLIRRRRVKVIWHCAFRKIPTRGTWIIIFWMQPWIKTKKRGLNTWRPWWNYWASLVNFTGIVSTATTECKQHRKMTQFNFSFFFFYPGSLVCTEALRDPGLFWMLPRFNFFFFPGNSFFSAVWEGKTLNN